MDINQKSIKIGFVGWNPFQLSHVKELLIAMPSAVFILEQKKTDYEHAFSKELLAGIETQIIRVKQHRMQMLDGQFDILVCQTPFKHIHLFSKTRIVMIQYGYAKEPHNYGAWRSFADLNLTFGAYATEKISHFSNVLAVGHPKFDLWGDLNFHENSRLKFQAILNPNKKTVLYAPTWGELSTVEQYLDAICALSSQYNVLVKLHHNSILLSKVQQQNVNTNNSVHFVGLSADMFELLSVTDVLISDYSGAIFDAILCEKPVVLLDLDKDVLAVAKLDEYSLEYRRRDELGARVNKPQDLLHIVTGVLSGAVGGVLPQTQALRDELFVSQVGCVARIREAVMRLAQGEFQPEQHHLYVRQEMQALYRYKNKDCLQNLLPTFQLFKRNGQS